ncbi:MAG: nucleotidyltransferase domain-containing protein, partial [Parahaliea sp.]
MNANVQLPAAMFDAAVFYHELAGGDTIALCKAALKTAAHYLDREFRAGVEAGELIRLRAQFMDGLLGALWQRQSWPADSALVAVGGYGRGELHPYSDVDILLLTSTDGEAAREPVEAFLRLLWDIGLAVGHSVRSVDDCRNSAAGDITVLTNLMEARVLRGSEALMGAVREAIAPHNMWPSAEFFRAKMAEQDARHNKYADTEYNLEPNVKGSPGGLRDLQV